METETGIRPSLHRRFSLPSEVVDDPSLSPAEKRAILAEWASDASAVPSHPTLRRLRGTNFPVTFSAVMAARRELDEQERFGNTGQDALRSGVIADFVRARTSLSRLRG